MGRQLPVFALAVTLAFPGAVRAEGAVQQLACTIVAACDAAAACAPGGDVAITLAPISSEGTINVVALTIDGIGPDGIDAEALQDGALGAFEWTTETASHWLIPAGPASLIWVEQTQGEAVSASIRILACSAAG